MREIYPLFSYQFFFNLIIFLLGFLVTFFIPGFVVLSKIKLKDTTSKLLTSPFLGIALWGLINYLFAWLKLRNLVYLYLLIFLILFIKQLKIKNLKINFAGLKKNKLLIFIIILGSLVELSTVFFSGLMTSKGIIFYWLNAFDGVFHISLINELIKNFPPLQPGAAGLPVTNYHYWSNMVMADFIRVWQTPITHTFFQYFPLVLSFLMGLVFYKLTKLLSNSKTAGLWAVFLLYFGADISYIFNLILHQNFNWQIASIDNGIIQFLNPPQTFAKILLASGLILLIKAIQEKNKKLEFISVLIFSTLVGFKIYFGIFAVLFYCLYVLLNFLKKRNLIETFIKNKLTILNVLIFALISSLIFFPVNKEAGGLFWAPLNWVKLYIGAENLNWNDWWLRMQVYQEYKNIKFIVFYNFLASMMFLISVYALKICGFFFNKTVAQKTDINIFKSLYITAFLFLFIGANTLQKSGGHNVFNFFVVSLIIFGILAAINLDYFLNKINNKLIKNLLIILSIMIILPRTMAVFYHQSRNYLKGFDATILTLEEYQALNYLAINNPNSTILVYSTDHWDKETPYISFFSNGYGYASGKVILESHNQPVQARFQLRDQIFKFDNLITLKAKLKESGADFIYNNNPQKELKIPFFDENEKLYYKTLEEIFPDLKIYYQNDKVKILKIN